MTRGSLLETIKLALSACLSLPLLSLTIPTLLHSTPALHLPKHTTATQLNNRLKAPNTANIPLPAMLTSSTYSCTHLTANQALKFWLKCSLQAPSTPGRTTYKVFFEPGTDYYNNNSHRVKVYHVVLAKGTYVLMGVHCVGVTFTPVGQDREANSLLIGGFADGIKATKGILLCRLLNPTVHRRLPARTVKLVGHLLDTTRAGALSFTCTVWSCSTTLADVCLFPLPFSQTRTLSQVSRTFTTSSRSA